MEIKRSTIYLDSVLHKALKMKAMQTTCSVSELVNEAVRQSLAEDSEDIKACHERRHEPVVSFESVVKKLKANGKI